MAGESLKILLVDDQEDNLFAMEDLLEKIGAEVYKAQSGQEALALVKQYDFATVLLDVTMPGMDGFEVARRIRDHEKEDHLPIIFLTGYKTNENLVFLGYKSGGG